MTKDLQIALEDYVADRRMINNKFYEQIIGA
jgi:hypothetical protein